MAKNTKKPTDPDVIRCCDWIKFWAEEAKVALEDPADINLARARIDRVSDFANSLCKSLKPNTKRE